MDKNIYAYIHAWLQWQCMESYHNLTHSLPKGSRKNIPIRVKPNPVLYRYFQFWIYQKPRKTEKVEEEKMVYSEKSTVKGVSSHIIT